MLSVYINFYEVAKYLYFNLMTSTNVLLQLKKGFLIPFSTNSVTECLNQKQLISKYCIVIDSALHEMKLHLRTEPLMAPRSSSDGHKGSWWFCKDCILGMLSSRLITLKSEKSSGTRTSCNEDKEIWCSGEGEMAITTFLSNKILRSSWPNLGLRPSWSNQKGKWCSCNGQESSPIGSLEIWSNVHQWTICSVYLTWS